MPRHAGCGTGTSLPFDVEVYESAGSVWDEGRVERVRRRWRGTTAGTLRQ